MPRRSPRHLLAALLILAVAALAAFGTARPALAAPPAVSIDPGYLYLNLEPGATAEAIVSVSAAPDQPVFAHANAGWLTLDDNDWLGSKPLTITATATGIAPGEIRVGKIQFSSYAALPVVLAVNGPSTPPPMAVTPSSVDFGTLTVGQYDTYYLNLALAEPADVSISADVDWLSMGPLGINGARTTVISISPVRSRLTTPGQYSGTIEVKAGDLPPLKIPVTLRIGSPEPAAPPAAPAAPVAEVPFTDVPADHWARGAIAELAADGVINGVGDGKFAPDETVTREQLAKLLVMAFGLSHEPDPSPYPDVASDRWSSPYIVAAGPFMARYRDGLFHPEIPAVREEIAVAMTLLKGLKPMKDPDLYRWFTDYTKITPSAQPWVATARSVGLIGGFPDRTFRPRDPVTRAQVAVLLQRARQICGSELEPGCAAPLGKADQTLAGATLYAPRAVAEAALGEAEAERPGYSNAYTIIHNGGNARVHYVTPGDSVWSVYLQGEGATPRGIKIGDSLEAVRQAYGPQGEMKDGVLTYRTGADLDFFYLQFFIIDGKVNAILLTQSK